MSISLIKRKFQVVKSEVVYKKIDLNKIWTFKMLNHHLRQSMIGMFQMLVEGAFRSSKKMTQFLKRRKKSH